MGSKGTTNSSRHNLTDMYNRDEVRVSDARVCSSRCDNSAVKNIKSTNIQGKKFMANNDIHSRGISKKKEGLDFVVKRKELATGDNNTFPSRSTKMARLMTLTEKEAMISYRNIKGSRGTRDRHANLNDEGNALKMLDASKKGGLRGLGYGYEVGDMVWGRVESHPWWPGQIFLEAFASPLACITKKEGHLLVAFYGDNTYGWLEPDGLIPFDPHYTEKSKLANTLPLLTAVGEAKDEVNRRAALGLTCFCRNPNNFRPTSVQGFLEVDVSGFENGSVYSVKKIEKARDGFQPIKTLSFVQKLALIPHKDVQRNVKWMTNVAHLLAYRRAVFEEFDNTYAEAFGVLPPCPKGSSMISNDSREVPPQASLRGQPMIRKQIGNWSSINRLGKLASENATEHSSSYSSKPSGKRLSSEESVKCQTKCLVKEKPFQKPKALQEANSLAENKNVQGDDKMKGLPEPATLKLRFPQRAALPSVSELKARFARFGKLDELATRVFSKSSTCRVVFKNVSSAQVAYNHALKTKALFGNSKVNYMLQTSKVSSSRDESSKRVVEESPDTVPKVKSGAKKSPDDENGSKSNRSTSATNTEIEVLMEESLDTVPKPKSIPKVKSGPKNSPDDENGSKSNGSTSATTKEIDISEQMLSLLIKCNDIVSGLMSSPAQGAYGATHK